MRVINGEYIDDNQCKEVMQQCKKMFEEKYLKRLMKKKKTAPSVKPKLMKMPEFRDSFVNEDQLKKNRASMVMKKIEKAVLDRMVINDGYNFRASLSVYADVAPVTPYLPTEVVSEANS